MMFSKFSVSRFCLVFSLIAMTHPAQSYAFRIEPVVGYQLQRKSNPERTTKSLSYGGRLVFGPTLLSLETEYNRAKSDENFPDLALKVVDVTERYRVGLRSDLSTGLLSFFRVRGGAEGRKITSDRTLSGTTTRNVSPTYVFPYVGAGLGMSIAPGTRVIAEVTAT
ncbi:MAG: hypothetical protein EOP09_10625, partial [Proteobacteria bacterium]